MSRSRAPFSPHAASSTRLLALDGLRGVAVLAVMIFHSGAPFLPGGYIGVDLFFVLSGFLITGGLVAEFDNCGRISIRDFYVRRLLRLAPALLAMLLIYTLLTIGGLSGPAVGERLLEAVIALFYAANWARAFGWHEMDFLGHTWSLSIEEQFYLAWPLLLYLGLRSGLDRHRLLLLISLLALGSGCWRIWLCAGGASIERLYNGLDTRLDGLMIGAALGLAMASGMLEALRPYCRGLLAWACVAAIAGLSWILLRIPADDPRMYQYGLVAVALAAMVLILHVCWNAGGLLDRILSWAPLVWLGSISYAIYLWHYPIFRWFSHAGYSGLFNLCVGSALSILLAAVSWRLLERPALAMKRRFAGARRPESAAAAA